MKLRTKLAGGAVAAVSLVGTTLAGPAAAGETTVLATRNCSPAPTCSFQVTGFPGGTISIDLDEYGSGTAIHRWDLINGAGSYQCYGTYRAIDPPRSWTCSGVVGGTVTVVAQMNGGGYIGIR